MSLESIIATLVIDAYERRHVVIDDVPGAYIHTEMPPDKRILLKLVSKFVELLMHKVVHVALTQMSVNKCFKLHGEHAVATMFKELNQLDRGAMERKPAVGPQDPDVLTDDNKKKIIRSCSPYKGKT